MMHYYNAFDIKDLRTNLSLRLEPQASAVVAIIEYDDSLDIFSFLIFFVLPFLLLIYI